MLYIVNYIAALQCVKHQTITKHLPNICYKNIYFETL